MNLQGMLRCGSGGSRGSGFVGVLLCCDLLFLLLSVFLLSFTIYLLLFLLLLCHSLSGNKQPARKEFGHFYGSSYISGPDSSRAPGLSRVRDGIAIAEADLNLCQQVRDSWGFRMTARYEDYAALLNDYVEPGFEPQVIGDRDDL